VKAFWAWLAVVCALVAVLAPTTAMAMSVSAEKLFKRKLQIKRN